MGGGGGGGFGLTPDELENLEQRAKKSLKGGDGTNKCNVFISFSSENLDEVNLLRGQAKNENSDIEFNDWSLKEPFDSKKADYIKRGIRERIRQCSVTVVYVSDKTADSKWVNWEILESISMGKGVVANLECVCRSDKNEEKIAAGQKSVFVDPKLRVCNATRNCLPKT